MGEPRVCAGLARGLWFALLVERFETPGGRSPGGPLSAFPNAACARAPPAPSPSFGGELGPAAVGVARTGLGARPKDGLARANVVVCGVEGAEPLATIRGRAWVGVAVSVGDRTSAGANEAGSTRALSGFADNDSDARFVDDGLRAGIAGRALGTLPVEVNTRRRPSGVGIARAQRLRWRQGGGLLFEEMWAEPVGDCVQR